MEKNTLPTKRPLCSLFSTESHVSNQYTKVITRNAYATESHMFMGLRHVNQTADKGEVNDAATRLKVFATQGCEKQLPA